MRIINFRRKRKIIKNLSQYIILNFVILQTLERVQVVIRRWSYLHRIIFIVALHGESPVAHNFGNSVWVRFYDRSNATIREHAISNLNRYARHSHRFSCPSSSTEFENKGAALLLLSVLRFREGSLSPTMTFVQGREGCEKEGSKEGVGDVGGRTLGKTRVTCI